MPAGVIRNAVLVICAVGLVAAGAWALHRPEPGIVGYNGVRPAVFVAALKPHRPTCMAMGNASSRPDRLRVTLGAGAAGAQPLRLTVKGSGRTTVLSDYADGLVDFPLPSGRSLEHGGVACLRNLGRAPVMVAGEPGGGATVSGRPQPYGISMLLVSGDPPTWGQEAGDIVRNVGAARAGAGGPVTGWIVVVLLVTALAGALAAAARWAR